MNLDPRNNREFELATMWTLSTAHLKQETVDLLQQIVDGDIETPFNGPVIYNKHEFGFFIYLPGDSIPEQSKENYPEELYKIIDFAYKHDIYLICFDRDGQECPYFQTQERGEHYWL